MEIRLPNAVRGRRRLGVSVAIIAVAAIPILALASTDAAPPEPEPCPTTPARRAARPKVFIEVSQWEAGTTGTWSAFTARINNTATTDFVGKLRLVPLRAASAPITIDPAAGPVYDKPVRIDAGRRRHTSMILPLAGIRYYRAELVDRSGKCITTGQPKSATDVGVQNQRSLSVGLLTDVANASSALLTGGSTVSFSERYNGADDFPTDAMSLFGVDVVIIDSVDTGRLRPEQKQALRDWVALGGNLLVGGGEAWARTVTPLPPELAPLRPTATATATLAPFADFAGIELTVPAVTAVPVATGDLTSGRVVLATKEGIPLMVEAPYGNGNVIQLTFDPLVEFRKFGGLVSAVRPWEVVFGRVRPVTSLEQLARARVQPTIVNGILQLPQPAEEPVWALLEQTARGRTASPLAILALLAYAGVAGPLSYRYLKRNKTVALVWLMTPALALGATALYGVAGVLRPAVTEHHMEFRRFGGDNTVRVDAYRGVSVARPTGHRVVKLPRDTSVEVAPVRPPRPEPIPRLFKPVASSETSFDRHVSLRPGKPTRVDLRDLRGWDLVRMRAGFVTSQRAGIDAELRVVNGRLTGRVTNRGSATLRDVEARTADGLVVEVAKAIEGGKTANVDVALPPPPPPPVVAFPGFGGPTTTTIPPPPKSAPEQLKDMVAAHERLRPGEVALVATYGGGSRAGAVVTRTMLVEADDFVAGLGTPVPIYMAGQTGTIRSNVYEMAVPKGIGRPILLSYPTRTPPPSVYNWATGTWRTPAENQPETTIDPAEVAAGVIRVRASELTGRTGTDNLALRVASPA